MTIAISIILGLSIIIGVVFFRYIFLGRSDTVNMSMAFMSAFGLLADLFCIFITVTNDINVLYIYFSLYLIFISLYMLGFHLFSIAYTTKAPIKIHQSPFTYLTVGIIAGMIINIYNHSMFKIGHVIFEHISFAYAVNSKMFSTFESITLVGEILFALIAFGWKIVTSAKIYRLRYVILSLLVLVQCSLWLLSTYCKWPIFIKCLSIVPVMLLVGYMTLFYSKTRLKNSTLLFAADKLNDGLVLYDEDDILIYTNDKMNHILTEDMLISFTKRDSFENWSRDLSEVDGVLLKEIEDSSDIEHPLHYYVIEKHVFNERRVYVGTCYTLRDMTATIERISAVEEANEELARAAHMKSDFLANMSHEIRTPMNAVIGMAEMALREEMTDQARDYIAQIKSSGRNLLNIINDILDFSKIESGKMEIIPDTYEPLSEFNDVANTLINRIGDKDIELTIDENPKIPAKLEGDIMRIRQILINLANNAIKFTQHGRVQITCDYRPLSAEEVMCSFHVVDTGQGIKEADLKKLFVSFQQVDSKRNRNVEGTGLGLAISKNLVEAMGGTIGVTSEYGKGSDFYFEIPQKIIDPNPSIQVENPENIFAFGMFRKKYLARRFFIDTNRMGVFSAVLRGSQDYDYTCETYENKIPGKKVYLFFEELDYGYIKPILEIHKDVIGVLLAEFSSNFKPDIDNLRVIKKPFSTMSIARALNNQILQINGEGSSAFAIDFTAPDANVLIVDDNPVNLTVAEGLLDPLKMKVYTASSGADAVNLIAEQQFDIVFMDHMMPDMDGVETTHVIRRMFPALESMPIIALTANAVNGAKEYFLKEGMNDFIPKPIEVRDILSKVNQWLPKEKIKKSVEVISISDEVSSELSIPGLEVESALKLIGSESVYIKILKEYYKNIEKNHQELQMSFANEDWENYTIKVHALKSSSKQIGAMELSEKAAKLESAGHANDIDFIKANSDDALKQYIELIPTLTPFCKEEEETSDKEIMPADTLSELLNRMKVACEDLDMDVMEEVVGELNKYAYSDETSDLITQLKDNAEIMDVDTCTEICDKLLDII